ncbi:hypothetical protein Pmani_025595 [Petrolisthes manimaculis]|uniref:Uncharacterized protein n=1 Tax=Petrolisthes manimaculis TaxID=1843537 RepID=A0AAE1P6X8_9EUCA|nr:hypothetical protein Pmani_025595 [Petrolisthes manimaculis]
MDESLILLKHLLCWGDEDVLTVARNVRKDYYRSYLSPQTVHTLQHYNSADYKIYNHFKERLEKQIQEFGKSRMKRKLED